jgi:mannosyl-oligosaccharide alpha-1,2-mannosidase
MGALSDSFYEYLLKMWLQGGKKETRWRKMYDEAVEGMTQHLLGQSGHLHFVGEKKGNRFVKKMEHLACFTGGMLALGAKNDPRGANSERAERDLRNAKSIAYVMFEREAREF